MNLHEIDNQKDSGEPLMERTRAEEPFVTAEHFDSEAFARIGHQIIELISDHLREARSSPRSSMPVLPDSSPEAMLQRFPADFTSAKDPVAFVREIIDTANHLHHPRYVGHQVSSPLPVSALLDLISAFLNNGSAIYEMGPASVAMERNLIHWLGGFLSFDKRCDGVFTSGGSAGNLTALLAARQAKAGSDIWSAGSWSGPPLAVLVADQAHYSVRRAAQIMGWGDDGVIMVPTDEHFRLRADALPGCLESARKAERRVIAVVASAGSSATGAIDPLPEVADFCRKEGLWFHVDGAHGASLALSESLRPRLAGIEHADSVVWDAHKMMLTPALLTAVVFRDGRHSYQAFAQEASYLYGDKDPSSAWYEVGMRTLECTKRMMGMVLYGTLAIHTAETIKRYIESRVALTAQFADEIQRSQDFELATYPDCNIVCFRYRVDDKRLSDETQTRIRERIVKSGVFYPVQTKLRGDIYLRLTLINPQTDFEDLLQLLNLCRHYAACGG